MQVDGDWLPGGRWLTKDLASVNDAGGVGFHPAWSAGASTVARFQGKAFGASGTLGGVFTLSAKRRTKMASFSTSSFFAGVGTVCVALTLGFAGGTIITSTPKVETLNRVQQVNASRQLPTPLVQVDSPVQKVETTQAVPPPVEQTSVIAPPVIQPVAQPAIPPQAIAKNEQPAPKADNTEISASEIRKAAREKREQDRRVADRRRKHDIEAAVNAVRAMKRDGVIQAADDGQRLSFFGDDQGRRSSFFGLDQ